MRRLLIVLALLAVGCDQRIDQVMDKLSGNKTNYVALAKEPIVLDGKGVSFTSSEPMLVVGGSSSVCLVLKTGVPLESQPIMDKQFEEAMQGVVVTATLKMGTGETYTLTKPGQGWAKFGRITSGEELSACFSYECDLKQGVGSKVEEVHFASSAPLKVLGIFWESTNAFDKIKNN